MADLLKITNNYEDKFFKYCTVMGGETTLLDDQLIAGFMREASRVAREVRMTTNGQLLTTSRMQLWKTHGLDGLNISVPAIGPKFQEITGSRMSSSVLTENIRLAQNVFGPEAIRVNIALCPENLEGKELEEMLWLFLHVMNVGVTICEDLYATYTVRDKLAKYGLKLVNDTGYGLVFLDFHGRDLACYAHTGHCNEVELIITPKGLANSWEEYANQINYEVKVDKTPSLA